MQMQCTICNCRTESSLKDNRVYNKSTMHFQDQRNKKTKQFKSDM